MHMFMRMAHFIDSYSAGSIPEFRSPNLESQIIEDRA